LVRGSLQPKNSAEAGATLPTTIAAATITNPKAFADISGPAIFIAHDPENRFPLFGIMRHCLNG
jgi:hypothetical protein